MSGKIKITTGDAPTILATLNINKAATPAITGTVTAAIIDKEKNVLVSSVSCPEANAGSDWANRVVSVIFTSVQTDITLSANKVEADIEIKTDDPLTWRVPVILETKGY